MTLILFLLLAVINASNVYGDPEIVNVKIGTYRKDHPSVANVNRRTLANDMKRLAESCGKPFNTDSVKIGGKDYNYKISFKAFCDCKETIETQVLQMRKYQKTLDIPQQVLSEVS
ncbi:hypothetical protein Aduo_007754 [Ancylostoma duodenale]